MNTKHISLVIIFSLILFSCGKKEPKKVVQPVAPKTEIKKEEPKEIEVKEDVLVFTVQIGAFYKMNQRYSALPNVTTYHVSPWYKYSLGAFSTYQEARTSRRNIIDTYPGAFVQALKNGNPIPIKEALK